MGQIPWYTWLTLIGVPSLCAGLITLVIAKFGKALKSMALLMKASQVNLKLQLRDKGEAYVKRGWVDIDHKQDYDDCYQIYHNLGKNGCMTALHEQVMALPIEPHVRPVRKSK